MSEQLKEVKEISTLYARISKCLEGYICKHHKIPSLGNPHGCTDCYNLGYIFDSEESHLLNESIEHMMYLETENESLEFRLMEEKAKVEKLVSTIKQMSKETSGAKVYLLIQKTLKEIEASDENYSHLKK